MGFGMRGLLDEPAHLAMALIILGALVRVRGVPPEQRFGWAMLACSVLIDLDHLPGEFGSAVLINGTPRPYPYASWTVLALALAWAIARSVRARRPGLATAELILGGAACGVAAHFARDIVTAPMSFWCPVTDMAVEVPYWWYMAALAVMIAIGRTRKRSRIERNQMETPSAGLLYHVARVSCEAGEAPVEEGLPRSSFTHRSLLCLRTLLCPVPATRSRRTG